MRTPAPLATRCPAPLGARTQAPASPSTAATCCGEASEPRRSLLAPPKRMIASEPDIAGQGTIARIGAQRYHRRAMKIRSTTVVCVRKDGKVALGADGQVTLDKTVMKHGARKLRRLGDGSVLAGFAGATADAFTLFDRFEGKLKDFNKNLARAAVELAKDWRTDRFLRRLEALLVVAAKDRTLILSGTGGVLEARDGVRAIGSGGPYAQAAAVALLKHSQLGARQIVEESLRIAARICIYTNDQISIEEL